ncbi:hypothetical protein [Spirillospora sp. NPDC029432]|uniref:hypothetical protein n=1 Tax=Spirillospora sp. NPDC029432 TaxID=3154599 RepID=UPI003456EDCF
MMRDTFENGRALRRGAVPVAALAVVAALPAVAVAAPPAPVPCTDGKGDEAALARAFHNGGTIILERDCVYSLTKKYGTDSVLPAVTRDTRVEGRKSTIAWRGTERVRSVIELAGKPRVRFEMRDVQMRTGRAMSNIRVRPGTSASISNINGGDASFWKRFFGVGRDDDGRTGARPAADRSATDTSRGQAPARTGTAQTPVPGDPEPVAPAADAPAPNAPAPEAAPNAPAPEAAANAPAPAPNAPADGTPAGKPQADQPQADQSKDQPQNQQPQAQQPQGQQQQGQQPQSHQPYTPHPYAQDPYAFDPYADGDHGRDGELSDEEERQFAAAFLPALMNGPLANLTDLGGLLGFLAGPRKGGR